MPAVNTIKIDDQAHAWLQTLKEVYDGSFSTIIKEAIKEKFPNIEDVQAELERKKQATRRQMAQKLGDEGKTPSPDVDD